jgi:hypothetical protein
MGASGAIGYDFFGGNKIGALLLLRALIVMVTISTSPTYMAIWSIKASCAETYLAVPHKILIGPVHPASECIGTLCSVSFVKEA